MNMNNGYTLTVIFCAVDETGALKNAFESIDKSAYISEFIFVLSQNASNECIKTAKKLCEDSRCRLIFQSGKGLGNAIKNAVDAARTSHMIVWPSDGGMDTSAFKTMVSLSQKHPESIVTVSRWLKGGGFEDYGRIRKIINGISQKMFAVLYGCKLTDFTNPTQIAPTELYKKIKWQSDGFELIPEMTFKPLRLGCRFIEVPCKNLKRSEGKKHNSIKDLVKYYFIAPKIRFMKTDDILKGKDI